MNTQLSWLIPLLGGIYLLGIRVMWMLSEHQRVKNFFDNYWKNIPKHHIDS